MINLPTLRQLQHLVALADERHFGRAAAASNVTQSTLSASIKELEGVLQASLVDRTKRSVVLTPLGEETAERARALLHGAQELALAANAQREPLSGTLRLGVIPTIGPFLLPKVLPRLRRRHPKLKLYLVEDLTQRLVEQLHAGKLDAVLIALPYDAGNVEEQVLFSDAFRLALPKDHPLAARKSIRTGDLAPGELLLLKEGHCLRDHAVAACRIADRRQLDAVEATSLPTLVQMVDNGLGITLLPEVAIEAGVLRGTSLATKTFAGDEPKREIGLIWRRGTGRRAEFQLLAKEIAAFHEGKTPTNT